MLSSDLEKMLIIFTFKIKHGNTFKVILIFSINGFLDCFSRKSKVLTTVNSVSFSSHVILQQIDVALRRPHVGRILAIFLQKRQTHRGTPESVRGSANTPNFSQTHEWSSLPSFLLSWSRICPPEFRSCSRRRPSRDPWRSSASEQRRNTSSARTSFIHRSFFFLEMHQIKDDFFIWSALMCLSGQKLNNQIVFWTWLLWCNFPGRSEVQVDNKFGKIKMFGGD